LRHKSFKLDIALKKNMVELFDFVAVQLYLRAALSIHIGS